MIEVENLTKVYGPHVAVRDLNFSVGRGEILGFLGPNGAGKSTTMRVLACYTPATSGRARIAGHDVASESFEARRKLGYLPESAPLYLSMRVRGFLEFMAGVKAVPRAGRKAAIDRAIEECGLEEAADRMIGNLSKGYRQRVGLAQAILGDPAVLILDEPTVGLDPRQIAGIRALIGGMAGQRTVLLSTHILPEVSMICQKVVVIDRGRIVASGTPERLVTASRTEEPPVQVVLAGEAKGAEEVMARVGGVEKVERRASPLPGRRVYSVRVEEGRDPRAELARALTGGGYDLIELSTPGHSLEDVFLRVIGSADGREEGS
jgi:ABC-2 type transport system ATP-binding protein